MLLFLFVLNFSALTFLLSSAGRQKLIFSFKDGLNLALDEKKVARGGIINFDLNYEQVDVEYEGPLLNMVSYKEMDGLE